MEAALGAAGSAIEDDALKRAGHRIFEVARIGLSI